MMPLGHRLIYDHGFSRNLRGRRMDKVLIAEIGVEGGGTKSSPKTPILCGGGGRGRVHSSSGGDGAPGSERILTRESVTTRSDLRTSLA
jgi:hypothetical protein